MMPTKNNYIVKQNTGQRIKIKNNVKIENRDVLFVAEKIEYRFWERFKEIISVLFFLFLLQLDNQDF